MSLTPELAESLISKLTDGLVNIKDETGEFLLLLPDGKYMDTRGWGGWEWTHGVALTGLWEHYKTTGSAKSRQTIIDWFNARKAEGQVHKNINTMAVFYALACLVESEGDKAEPWWTEWIVEWADWLVKELPRTREGGFQHMTYVALHEQQLWDDTLMMSVIPLAKIGLLLNKPEYVEEAKYQFLIHIQYLADTKTGLWFHGYQFGPENKLGSGNNFARALWNRGNCWITLAIPMFLELIGPLSPSDPLNRTLLSTLNRQIEALSYLPDPETGLWHTLLDDTGSYLEASGSAAFSAGIMKGVGMGIVSDKYLPMAIKALDGVLAKVSPETGEVTSVSFGTGMGYDLQHYRDIPLVSMPYGQSLLMTALIEWEKLQKATK